MKKLSILILSLLVSILSFSQTSNQEGTKVRNVALVTNFDKAPYILYTGKNTEMLILWQTLTTASCTIQWGTDETYSVGSQITTEYGAAHQHKITLTNLTPNTKYFYKVTSNGEIKKGSFMSGAVDAETAVSFYSYGDTRTYPAIHDAVAQKMMNEIKLDPKSQTLVLMNGDLVQYGSTETSWTSEFFDPQYTNIQELLANVPYLSTMGNHEGQGLLFGKYFPYPEYASGRFYYSFDYGPVHFAVIDQYTDYSPGSAQYAWLENDLASSKKSWKMIMDHEPGWTAFPVSGGHGNNTIVQTYIQPLCLKYGVSFVFSGHDHYYSRANVNNVIHITTGGGGAPLYIPADGRENVVIYDKSNHFCKIEIDKNALKLTARRSDGSVIEVFDYVKSTIPGILISPSNATLTIGKTQQLTAVIWPSELANEPVTWSTNNAAVATVSSSGLVTAVANGAATITASIQGGAKIATANIGVIPLVTTIDLDNCDALTDWKSSKTLVLNAIDKKQGTNCIEFVGSSTDEFKKVFAPTVNSGATTANGILKFWYYVSDATKCGTISVELGSGGAPDVNELSWRLTGIASGWNQISLRISNATISGTPDLSAINWFRIYDIKSASITTRIDAILLGPENLVSGINELNDSNFGKGGQSFHLSPNPSHQKKLTVNLFGFDSMKNILLSIHQLDGQRVYQKRLSNSKQDHFELPENLKESIYFVTVESGQAKAVNKLILN
ncbi:MAG: metallophosphoesterase [Bacteroidia bacterium]|nr:metallophosphoesterase [Bacteroidia bacterium]